MFIDEDLKTEAVNQFAADRTGRLSVSTNDIRLNIVHDDCFPLTPWFPFNHKMSKLFRAINIGDCNFREKLFIQRFTSTPVITRNSQILNLAKANKPYVLVLIILLCVWVVWDLTTEMWILAKKRPNLASFL